MPPRGFGAHRELARGFDADCADTFCYGRRELLGRLGGARETERVARKSGEKRLVQLAGGRDVQSVGRVAHGTQQLEIRIRLDGVVDLDGGIQAFTDILDSPNDRIRVEKVKRSAV